MNRRLIFDWDASKEASNFKKHGVEFWNAAEIFDDPNVHSTFDRLHSDDENRYMSIGMDYNGRVLLMVHTYAQLSENEVAVRMISARRPTKRELKTYWKERK